MCCEPVRIEEMRHPAHCSCGCWQAPAHRHFFSRQEEKELLEKYRSELEQELEGVKEKIKGLAL